MWSTGWTTWPHAWPGQGGDQLLTPGPPQGYRSCLRSSAYQPVHRVAAKEDGQVDRSGGQPVTRQVSGNEWGGIAEFRVPSLFKSEPFHCYFREGMAWLDTKII